MGSRHGRGRTIRLGRPRLVGDDIALERLRRRALLRRQSSALTGLRRGLLPTDPLFVILVEVLLQRLLAPHGALEPAVAIGEVLPALAALEAVYGARGVRAAGVVLRGLTGGGGRVSRGRGKGAGGAMG